MKKREKDARTACARIRDIGKQDVLREQRSSVWLELGPHGEELARRVRPSREAKRTGSDNAGAIQRL